MCSRARPQPVAEVVAVGVAGSGRCGLLMLGGPRSEAPDGSQPRAGHLADGTDIIRRIQDGHDPAALLWAWRTCVPGSSPSAARRDGTRASLRGHCPASMTRRSSSAVRRCSIWPGFASARWIAANMRARSRFAAGCARSPWTRRGNTSASVQARARSRSGTRDTAFAGVHRGRRPAHLGGCRRHRPALVTDRRQRALPATTGSPTADLRHRRPPGLRARRHTPPPQLVHLYDRSRQGIAIDAG